MIHKLKPISNNLILTPDPSWDYVELGETGVKLQVPTEYNSETQSRAASWEKEKHAPTSGVVVGVPESLNCNAVSYAEEFPWETEMELRVGDTIVYNYLQELHAVADGRKLDNGDSMMRYDHVICAVRSSESMEQMEGVTINMDAIPKLTPKDVFDLYKTTGNLIYKANPPRFIIPVNGYIIVEALPEEDIVTSLIIPTSLKRRKSIMKGRILYIGTPLKSYKHHPEFGADTDELKTGDEIIFHKTNAIPLQNSMHQIIDKGKTLYQMQRIDVDLYRRNVEGWHPWIPCSNRVLVKYDPKAVTRNVGGLSLVIPENQRKFPDQGTVIGIGMKVADTDVTDKVYFFRGCGTPVTLDKDDFIVLKEPEIGVIRKP